jgi:glutathione synthase/RimK-type ligase-like ATP-grasp enzyme
MHRIGIMVGRENTFPTALIEEINRRSASCKAEFVKLDGVRYDMTPEYDVILDRISHEVPFYQAYLKLAALNGTRVVCSPFWKLCDDKLFGTAVASKLGIAVPKTVALPQKETISDITSESLRNLKYPIDWEGIMDWIGWPAIIKPHAGGGWKSVDKVTSFDELFASYDRSKQLVMIIQEFIVWEQYVRCLCIGQEQILAMPWDPTKPHHLRYTEARSDIPAATMRKIEEQARQLNRAMGYDMNTMEFALRDGVPYAIDFLNTAPDMDAKSLTPPQFEWAYKAMADLLIEKAKNPGTAPAMRYDAFLKL